MLIFMSILRFVSKKKRANLVMDTNVRVRDEDFRHGLVKEPAEDSLVTVANRVVLDLDLLLVLPVCFGFLDELLQLLRPGDVLGRLRAEMLLDAFF